MLIISTNPKLKLFLLPLFIILSFNSCNDNDELVPNVLVNFSININDPEFNDLTIPGNFVYVTGGAKGIIIFRKTLDEFSAYDRTCTFDPSESCSQVSVDSTGVFATCPCCGSEFELFNGYVNKDPASLPLKQYNTSFDGYTIYVYN